MYVWIWQALPGGRASKITGSVFLVLAVCLVLLFFVFPLVEPLLPYNNITVE